MSNIINFPTKKIEEEKPIKKYKSFIYMGSGLPKEFQKKITGYIDYIDMDSVRDGDIVVLYIETALYNETLSKCKSSQQTLADIVKMEHLNEVSWMMRRFPVLNLIKL